jgi:AmmeMemoRadiSam system protein B
MAVRRAAVAGTWYPAAAAALTRQVQSYLDEAGRASEHLTMVPGPDAEVLALIAPHAGLMYSGPVAAFAYRLLRTRQYDSIVLVGPSHYVGFHGASIWPAGAFETPLGQLAIDERLSATICDLCPDVEDRPAAHKREHSLEMQLPFLALLTPSTPIVPIVMGLQTRHTALMLGDAIAHATKGRRVLIIASSDLSHFHDAATATQLDAKVIDRVDAMDDEGLMMLLETRADHACGGGPMVSVLRAARHLGARTSRVLRYADSGDVSGDKSSVVGYLAAAVWR